MPTVDELKQELDDVVTLQSIASAFTESAAARIQKIRDAFETNKEFYTEISYLYHLVRASSAKQLGKKTDDGKKVMIAVTSNQRFYGNINISIMQQFVEDAKKTDMDLIVIGSTGNDFISNNLEKKYRRVVFAKDNPSEAEAKEFLESIKQYRTVIMYYPKFVTLMTQSVNKTDIAEAENVDIKVGEDEINILFEPDLSQIIDFFENQVRQILFLRVMLETDLARTAARLLTMNAAEERSRDTVKTKKQQLRKMQAAITNAKLLETFAAMSGWKKD